MEQFYSVFTGVYGVALAWCCLTLFRQDKKLALIEKTLHAIEANQDRINTRIDLLMKTEIDTFKEMFKAFQRKE